MHFQENLGENADLMMDFYAGTDVWEVPPLRILTIEKVTQTTKHTAKMLFSYKTVFE